MAVKRYQQKFGGLARMVVDTGESQAVATVSRAIDNFASKSLNIAKDFAVDYEKKKGAQLAQEYDPITGAPDLKGNKYFSTVRDVAYNNEVLYAHSLYTENQISGTLKNYAEQFANDPIGYRSAVTKYFEEETNNINPTLANRILPKYVAQTNVVYDAIKNEHIRINTEKNKETEKTNLRNKIQELTQQIKYLSDDFSPTDTKEERLEKETKYKKELDTLIFNAQEFISDLGLSPFLTADEVQAYKAIGVQKIYQAQIESEL